MYSQLMLEMGEFGNLRNELIDIFHLGKGLFNTVCILIDYYHKKFLNFTCGPGKGANHARVPNCMDSVAASGYSLAHIFPGSLMIAETDGIQICIFLR